MTKNKLGRNSVFSAAHNAEWSAEPARKWDSSKAWCCYGSSRRAQKGDILSPCLFCHSVHVFQVEICSLLIVLYLFCSMFVLQTGKGRGLGISFCTSTWQSRLGKSRREGREQGKIASVRSVWYFANSAAWVVQPVFHGHEDVRMRMLRMCVTHAGDFAFDAGVRHAYCNVREK